MIKDIRIAIMGGLLWQMRFHAWDYRPQYF
jgi:hypothetical protein